MSPVNIFLFLTGMSSIVVFQFGGDLYLTDLLLTACFFFSVLMGRTWKHLFHGPILLLIILGSLYMLNAVITDIYRGTPFEDWSRGCAKIGFFFSNLFGLIILTQLKLSRIVAFMLGIAFASLFQPIIQHYDGADAWKFGYSGPLTTFAALAGATVLARRLFGAIGEWAPLALLGVMNLVFDYRSMFGIAMAAAAFGILKHAIDFRPQLRARITPAFFVVLVGAGLAFSQGMIAVYATAADNGWLGLDAMDKYLAQTSGDLSLIGSGRTEMLASVQAIADSPIVGHGSWAKDYAYVSLMIDILESKGVTVVGEYYGGDLIPTHSHLFSAWVEAGIMGGVFWLAVIGIAIKALYLTLKRQRIPATFVAFILIWLLWDIMFSPFGGARRFVIPAEICVALWVLAGSRHKPDSSGSESVGAAL